MSTITPIPTILTKEFRLECGMLVGHHLGLALSYNQMAMLTWLPWKRRRYMKLAATATQLAQQHLDRYREVFQAMH